LEVAAGGAYVIGGKHELDLYVRVFDDAVRHDVHSVAVGMWLELPAISEFGDDIDQMMWSQLQHLRHAWGPVLSAESKPRWAAVKC
jgi:hypothetical protein